MANKENSFFTKVNEIQVELKAPKTQYNSFGKYHYRNCEDILEALKPILKDSGMIITLSDTVKQIGDRFYVEATASISDGISTISATAMARETDDKKGMDAAQITGAASSYARKYALNGLFLIDDAHDADNQDNTQNKVSAQTKQTSVQANKVIPQKPNTVTTRLADAPKMSSVPKTSVSSNPVPQAPVETMTQEDWGMIRANLDMTDDEFYRWTVKTLREAKHQVPELLANLSKESGRFLYTKSKEIPY